MYRFLLLSSLFLFLLVGASSVLAGACAYSGALMAMERGNAVRGMALMRMASRDGDPRAAQYLAARVRDHDSIGESVVALPVRLAELKVALTLH